MIKTMLITTCLTVGFITLTPAAVINHETMLNYMRKLPASKHGEFLYDQVCAACHTPHKNNSPIEWFTQDAPKIGDTNAWRRIKNRPMNVTYAIVRAGHNLMPEKGGCHGCSQQELIKAIHYMMNAKQPISQ